MSSGRGKQWVLLAAGSKGWENYRHQANVCSAYQMVKNNKIPDDQIIVMMYDDIANNEQNPNPGEIINEPNGEDVYAGVKKDYTGEDVSARNFLDVLSGDQAVGADQAGRQRKVLRSNEKDTIFIFLSALGGPGMVSFPNDMLHASDLISTIKEMVDNRRFSRMVIYIESAYSGSMIEHLPIDAPANQNLVAKTRLYGWST